MHISFASFSPSLSAHALRILVIFLFPHAAYNTLLSLFHPYRCWTAVESLLNLFQAHCLLRNSYLLFQPFFHMHYLVRKRFFVNKNCFTVPRILWNFNKTSLSAVSCFLYISQRYVIYIFSSLSSHLAISLQETSTSQIIFFQKLHCLSQL